MLHSAPLKHSGYKMNCETKALANHFAQHKLQLFLFNLQPQVMDIMLKINVRKRRSSRLSCKSPPLPKRECCDEPLLLGDFTILPLELTHLIYNYLNGLFLQMVRVLLALNCSLYLIVECYFSTNSNFVSISLDVPFCLTVDQLVVFSVCLVLAGWILYLRKSRWKQFSILNYRNLFADESYIKL